MGPDDRIIAVLPFFHIYGMTVLMNLPLRHGATVVVLPRFDLAAVPRRSSSSSGSPGPSSPRRSSSPWPSTRPSTGRDLSALTFISRAAAPLDAELAEIAAAAAGRAAIGQAYGMTELSPGTHLVPTAGGRAAPPGTVGKLVPVAPRRGWSTSRPARTSARARRARSGSAARSG